MKRRNILTAVLLPVLLAAAVLILGTLVPGWLLGRQEEKLRAQANTVPVDAVRPYGDDYDEMKQELLGGIHAIFALEDNKYEDVAEKDVSDTVSAALEFLQTWSDRTEQYGVWLGNDLVSGQIFLQKITSSASDSYALTLDVMAGQEPYGVYSASVSENGIPIYVCVRMDGADSTVVGYLWQSLRETYQSRCGLSFNVILESEYGASTNAADDDAAVSGDGSVRSYAAVSSDMSLRLELNWESFETKYGSECWFYMTLTENTENDF